MKIKTRQASWGIEIKVDEVTTDIPKNGNESNEFLQNLLETAEQICSMRNETLFKYLENYYNIKITE